MNRITHRRMTQNKMTLNKMTLNKMTLNIIITFSRMILNSAEWVVMIKTVLLSVTYY